MLRLRGRVPTYYMKQLLQSRLTDIDGVDWIDNEVDVVSSVGLSSPGQDRGAFQRNPVKSSANARIAESGGARPLGVLHGM